jgi:phosphocarrier protein HPr
MAAQRVTICNKKGLHARAAAKLVNLSNTFAGTSVTIVRLPRPNEGDKTESAGGTSILSLLMLAAENGVEIEVRAEGPQADEAIVAIVALVARKFDEGE